MCEDGNHLDSFSLGAEKNGATFVNYPSQRKVGHEKTQDGLCKYLSCSADWYYLHV